MNIKKTVRLGTVEECNGKNESVFCRIEYIDEKLSITGVIGPRKNGNCAGSCGQINMGLNPDDITPAPGWSSDLIRQFLAVWGVHHLNDLTAGSPKQEEFISAYKTDNPDWKYEYTEVCNLLKNAGLNPDASYMHNDKPYKYGHAWLHTAVPNEVLTFLAGLPETDKTPAWV